MGAPAVLKGGPDQLSSEVLLLMLLREAHVVMVRRVEAVTWHLRAQPLAFAAQSLKGGLVLGACAGGQIGGKCCLSP